MFKWLALLVALWASPAAAQGNPTCPTRPLGDTSNACASTAFVNRQLTGSTTGSFTPNAPVVGNATSNGLVSGTRSGNTTLFPTVDAAPVNGNCAVFDSFGGLNNTPCSPSGSGTVGPGLTNQIAIYPSGGTSVVGSNTLAGAYVFTGANNFQAQNLFAPSSTNWLQTYSYGSGIVAGLDNTAIGVTVGISGASRASDLSVSSASTIGTVGWGFGDGSGGSANEATWGGYFESRTYPGATGYGQGVEIDITNLTGSPAPVTDPYNSSQPGLMTGLRIGSGGGCTVGAPCYNPATTLTNLSASKVSSAISIVPNSALYDGGIVFGCGSIGTTDCLGNGSGEAIRMYDGLALVWYSPGNSQVFNIQVSPATTRLGGLIAWGPGGLNFGGSLATSSSGGGQYLCIDNNHYVYQKSSCP